MSLTEPHNEFLELCAVSTSGQLTEEEQKKLQEHLVVCRSCREVLKQYEAVVRQAVPVIAASETTESTEPDSSWSEEQAEKAFLKRLEQEQRVELKKATSTADISPSPHRLPPFSSESTWRHLWMLYAAGILLFVSLSRYAYWAGVHRGTDIAKLAPPQSSAQTQPTLEAQLSDAGHEREIARAQIEQGEKTIADLRRQLAGRVVETNALKAAQDRLENDLHASDASRQDLVQQRAELAPSPARKRSSRSSTLWHSSQPRTPRAQKPWTPKSTISLACLMTAK